MNRRPFVLIAPAWLAGCGGSLLPKPATAPAHYTLDDGQAATVASAPSGAPVLLLAALRAQPGFDSSRMVYLRQPQVLEAFAQSDWVDTPAQMLAPLLLRALQASGAFAAVLQAPSAASAAWRLEVELVRLQQDFTQRPSRLRLTLRAVLVDGMTRQVMGAQEFDESTEAASDDAAGGAAAARQAATRVASALARFCAAHVKRPA